MEPNIPTSTLSSTNAIPLVGFGTAEYPFGATSPASMKDFILQAIETGYRHFDSASLYRTEVPLGQAISEALKLGLIQSRDELFITSKLWCSDAHSDRVLPALQKTLKNLELEYLDLYLIHWPVSSTAGNYELPVKKEELLPMDFRSVWEAMENCQKLGLAKSIGVSNFSIKKLDNLLATAQIPPAVNQVEMSPLWRQKKLREYCEEKGIHVTAYSPLGAKGMLWGTNKVMESEVLKEIADANGKTIAQVCLRWVYEQGVSVLVKSFNKERMKANLDIFDWKLRSEDLRKINQIPQERAFVAPEFVSDEGQYKSVVDLWDEEIYIN